MAALRADQRGVHSLLLAALTLFLPFAGLEVTPDLPQFVRLLAAGERWSLALPLLEGSFLGRAGEGVASLGDERRTSLSLIRLEDSRPDSFRGADE